MGIMGSDAWMQGIVGSDDTGMQGHYGYWLQLLKSSDIDITVPVPPQLTHHHCLMEILSILNATYGWLSFSSDTNSIPHKLWNIGMLLMVSSLDPTNLTIELTNLPQRIKHDTQRVLTKHLHTLIIEVQPVEIVHY